MPNTFITTNEYTRKTLQPILLYGPIKNIKFWSRYSPYYHNFQSHGVAKFIKNIKAKKWKIIRGCSWQWTSCCSHIFLLMWWLKPFFFGTKPCFIGLEIKQPNQPHPLREKISFSSNSKASICVVHPSLSV